MSIRPVKRLAKSKPTLEGAGVHLLRLSQFTCLLISVRRFLISFTLSW